MGLFSWLFGAHDAPGLVSSELDAPDLLSPAVNPATGLPMLDESFDVMGNPYGFGDASGVSTQDDLMGFHNDW